MALQYKFFIIPAANAEESEAELNRFLNSVRVITIHREFIQHGERSFWTMAVEYMKGAKEDSGEISASGKKKVDYKEVLSPEDFAVFVKLRDWRKTAAAQEEIPVYTIFTNEQLAKIAEKRIVTKDALKEVEGIGDARVKKYGDAVIKIVSESSETAGSQNETEKQSVSSDSNA